MAEAAPIPVLSSKQVLSLFDAGIDLTLDPQLFLVMERLCKSALTHSLNHSDVRHSITNLYLHLSRESLLKYGVNSIDVTMLHQTLLDKDRTVQQKPDVDVIALLAQGKHPRLGPDLVAAALLIRRVWAGFGRFLKLSARSYTRTGPKKRTKALDPVMVMSPDLLILWSEQYKPWIEQARKQIVETNNQLTQAQVVLKIVNDDIMPEMVDKLYGLARGQSIRILRHQLHMFIDPFYETR